MCCIRELLIEAVHNVLFTDLLSGQGEPLDGRLDLDVLCCIRGRDISVHLVEDVTECALLVGGLDLGSDASSEHLEHTDDIWQRRLQTDFAEGEVWVARALSMKSRMCCSSVSILLLKQLSYASTITALTHALLL